MSYDYFLWRTHRRVAANEIDESTVEPWGDPEQLRAELTRLYPTLRWRDDFPNTAHDTDPRTAFWDIQVPSPDRDRAPISVRTSHRGHDQNQLRRLAQRLNCLVYDAQTGEILWQPGDPLPEPATDP